MPFYTDHTEKELLRLLSEGDEKAFAELYTQYAPLVYRMVMKRVNSAELSNDITQDAFIKIWETRERLTDIRSFQAYLLTVSKNQSLDILRRASIDKQALAIVLNGYQLVSNRTEEDLRTAEYMEYLDKQLEQLSPQSREVFRLCRQEYKTYDEAAEILGISRNTVKKHLTKSMRILNEAVQRDLGITLSVLLTTIVIH